MQTGHPAYNCAARDLTGRQSAERLSAHITRAAVPESETSGKFRTGGKAEMPATEIRVNLNRTGLPGVS